MYRFQMNWNFQNSTIDFREKLILAICSHPGVFGKKLHIFSCQLSGNSQMQLLRFDWISLLAELSLSFTLSYWALPLVVLSIWFFDMINWVIRSHIIGHFLPKTADVARKLKILNISEFNRTIWKILLILTCPYQECPRIIGIRNGSCFQLLDLNIPTVK